MIIFVFLQDKTDVMRKHESWGEKLSNIVEFYGGTVLDVNHRTETLNSFTKILDVERFINSHLYTVRAQDGNPTFLPDLIRLYKFKDVIFRKIKYRVDTEYLYRLIYEQRRKEKT